MYTTMPELKDLMIRKNWGIETLAKAAGVSKDVVTRGRDGGNGKKVNAAIILETIKTKAAPTKLRKGVINVPQTKHHNSIKVRGTLFAHKGSYEVSPDAEYSLSPSIGVVSRGVIPCAKTEAEIERMHEYNRIMGRR